MISTGTVGGRNGDGHPSRLDMMAALRLLAAVVRGRSTAGDHRDGNVVDEALALARLDDIGRDCSLRDLYSQGRFGGRITLGALVVLDAAERSESAGPDPAAALAAATRVANRFADLLPDTAHATVVGMEAEPAPVRAEREQG